MVILVENKLEEVNDKEKQSNEDEQWELNKKYYQTALKKKRKKSLSMKRLKKYLIMMLQNNLRIS
jgi:hypothetical protein